jgi:hypothetical protein
MPPACSCWRRIYSDRLPRGRRDPFAEQLANDRYLRKRPLPMTVADDFVRGFAAKREVRGRKPVSAAASPPIASGRKNERKRMLNADGLSRPPGDSRRFFREPGRGACGRLGSHIARSAAPRASQGEGQQRRFEKILRQEPNRRNCDAIAHEAEGLD